MENELKAVDGETPWDMEFGAQLFCIKGLLPQGVCILGGASKIGKSWMVLDWVDKVAKGEPVWGMETTQTVLKFGGHAVLDVLAILGQGKCYTGCIAGSNRSYRLRIVNDNQAGTVIHFSVKVPPFIFTEFSVSSVSIFPKGDFFF